MLLWGHFSAVEVKMLTAVLALCKWRVSNKRKWYQPYGSSCHQTTSLSSFAPCENFASGLVWRHHKACDSFPPEEVFYGPSLPGFDVKANSSKLLFVPGSFVTMSPDCSLLTLTLLLALFQNPAACLFSHLKQLKDHELIWGKIKT